MVRPFATVALVGLAVLGLAACSGRGLIILYPPAATVGAVEEIYVASARSAQDGSFGYSGETGEGLSYSRVEVSVPPDRRPGTVRFPERGRVPDPQTDFLVVAATRMSDPDAFVRAVNAEVASRPPDQRDAVVFVHGFNTNFAEGLYRQAQMRHDFQSPGISVNFAWPSAARISAYGRDRESALVARDELQVLLGLLSRTKVSGIIVVAHSMGAFVAMESLRQTALAGDRATLSRIDSVVLIAPDLDIEVFRHQMRPLADNGIEAFVITSSRDTALRLSARLRGSTQRLGLVTDGSQVSGLPVEVIDLSDLDTTGDVSVHFKVATSPAVIAMVQGMGTLGLETLRDQSPDLAPIAAGAGLIAGAALVLSDPGAPR